MKQSRFYYIDAYRALGEDLACGIDILFVKSPVTNRFRFCNHRGPGAVRMTEGFARPCALYKIELRQEVPGEDVVEDSHESALWCPGGSKNGSTLNAPFSTSSNTDSRGKKFSAA